MASVTGYAWYDVDGNDDDTGPSDDNDVRFRGLTVRARAGNTLIAQTLTAEDGSYTIGIGPAPTPEILLSCSSPAGYEPFSENPRGLQALADSPALVRGFRFTPCFDHETAVASSWVLAVGWKTTPPGPGVTAKYRHHTLGAIKVLYPLTTCADYHEWLRQPSKGRWADLKYRHRPYIIIS